MELPQEVSFDTVYAESVGLPMVSKSRIKEKNHPPKVTSCS